MSGAIEDFFKALRPADDGQPRFEVQVTDVFTLSPSYAVGLTFAEGWALITRSDESPVKSLGRFKDSLHHYEGLFDAKPSNMTQLGYVVLRAALVAGDGAELWVSGDGKYAILTGANNGVRAERVARAIRESAHATGHHRIKVMLHVQ